MKIYDISMEINENIVVWKNKENKRPKFMITAAYDKDGMNESRIDMDLHTGTHADSYFHMLANGNKINEMALDKFIGSCIVLDFTSIKDKITISDLKKLNKRIKKRDIVLLKTKKKPAKEFDFNFTYLEKSGAEFLANKKVKAVGIDSVGVERSQAGHETHKILFKKNIPIIEGLELSKIKPGRYFFIGLPLKIKNGDASPIRAVLARF
ncbi:cyclase family protein [Candidatus Woesearchaeota archaeon]|nr:cyclase family protein [Candidatus Woesearchaeota archaeon]